MTLRIRMFFLVLIAILPAIAIQTYSAIALRRAHESEVHEEALRHARLAASSMREIVESGHRFLLVLTRLPEVLALDPAPCAAALRRILRELPAYANVAAADRTGRIVCTGASDAPAPHAAVADRTYFRDVLLTGAFVVGAYAEGRATGRKVLPLAHPIVRDGETVGVLAAGLDLQWLDAHFARHALPAGATLTVVDNDGTVIVRRPEDGHAVGEPLPPAMRPYFLGGHELSIEAVDADGIDRIAGYVPTRVPWPGFAVAVGVDRRQAFAAIDASTARGLAQILGSLALGFAAAWLVGRHFVRRPVSALLDATRRWQSGEFGARVQLGDRRSEIGQLARAFDDLAERLEELLRQKDMLLREVNHRVMNNLQLLSSVLALQRRRIADPAAREQLEQTRRRIQSMALVHRRLHRHDAVDVLDLSRFLRELCEEVARFSAPADRAVDLRIASEPVWIGGDRVIPVALIVFELLTNALKHARPAAGPQILRVGCGPGPGGTLVVTVADNGPGLSGDSDPPTSLGRKLIDVLVQQLRGSLAVESGPTGMTCTLRADAGSSRAGQSAAA